MAAQQCGQHHQTTSQCLVTPLEVCGFSTKLRDNESENAAGRPVLGGIMRKQTTIRTMSIICRYDTGNKCCREEPEREG